jgi:hypothetical protein
LYYSAKAFTLRSSIYPGLPLDPSFLASILRNLVENLVTVIAAEALTRFPLLTVGGRGTICAGPTGDQATTSSQAASPNLNGKLQKDE